MAKGTKNNRRTKAKSNRRAQNAFEIAQREELSKNDDSDSSDDGAIVDPRKKFRDQENDGSDEEFEDEEIDSDEALGSDDDFDVLNSKFSQTIRDKQKKLKKGEVDDDEEDDDEEDGYHSVDESEFLPLSAVWDLDDKDIAKNKNTKDIVLDDQWESESEEVSDDDEESESDDDDEDDEEFPFEDVNDQEDGSDVELTNLKKQLTKKEKKERKHYQDFQIEENELALPGGGQEISLADMLSVVDQDSSKNAMLIDKDNEESAKSLAIPLPKRIQDRHERKAAYEISKDEVDKWRETVKQNREAEVLSFPMNKPTEHNAASTFQETPALTDLEQKVNGVLNASSLLDDKKESTFEEIATAKMSVEEMRKRQNELRKMRELMFRNEREAKRIKKIKSKSYRRIKKKELLKNQALVEGDESDDEDHDSKRAQERMSLKHKNNSNWSKSMIKSGLSKDKEARDEMEDMLRRGEALKSKILDRDESDDEFGDSNDLNLDKDVEYESESETRENLGKTGVLNMAFMKNAEARERTRNEETKRNLRALEENEDINAFNEAESNSGVNKHINSGRRIYTPGASKSNADMKEVNENVLEEHEIDESKSLTNKLNKKEQQRESLIEKNKKKTEDEANKEVDEDESNPWLTSNDSNVQKSRKIRVTDKDSSKLEKNASKLNKQRKRKANEIEEPEQIIDMNQTLKVVDPHGEDSDHSDNDDDSNIHMFKQQDLIKQAFAGDDVVQEFEAEKKQVMKDEGDQIEDLTLPGWGDWAGGKTKNKKQKKNKIVKKTKGIDLDKRKDKNLKNVIINEKVNKKNAKYQSSAVPFPFENREQYERSLRMPIGQEWTSRETHQRLTMPKVTIKSGHVIDPLKAPFK
ncbi:U3 small nucleolar RNA-associated protein [Wickerhamomyces ciferrii]|uniref:U3 small nucleolar RNA-associated protein n=1 Tax=Wickerhamomyces ciferrii (strain ATCC 14091 / BCRC 22168 / CBS 111 / JCM 3599 / NBRC 0793 / NRRL Y-1031 F-60-10) TaxID=1206466 RepID=K0KW63_WICCF|nr:U3 small nucleolar RNA-associated protein [Wickerhamomyces ciferrii]CCH45378.1 U3 small nucleolar RNA-associated protein [Wickerhamomyces ciferrii]